MTKDVDAPDLRGPAAAAPSDDGVNVWIDGGHRMHFADVPAWQPVAADPILDPWTLGSSVGFDFDMALGAIIMPQGLRAIYQTYYEDSGPLVSAISLRQPLPGLRLAALRMGSLLGRHRARERGLGVPWVIDAHLFQDPDDGRLWMSWGGHVAWVTELDPATGRVLGNPASPLVSTHAPGTHTKVLCWPESAALGGDPAQPSGWCGDTDSTCYMEGAALYKHDGWWYVFGTYGNLEADYTIRMGRSRSPRGPFLDKEGVDLTRYEVGLGRYGASMFLAGEGATRFPATLTCGGKAIVTSSATTGGASRPTTAIEWPCARCASSTSGRRSGRRSRSCSGWTTSLRRKVGTSRWASRTWAGRDRWRASTASS